MPPFGLEFVAISTSFRISLQMVITPGPDYTVKSLIFTAIFGIITFSNRRLGGESKTIDSCVIIGLCGDLLGS
jgi:hypothetical protein